MASTSGPPNPGADRATSDPASPPDAPLLFGRYQIERELGRGGMGRVLLAFDTKLRIHVAIKLVPEQVMADAGAAEDLRTEVLRGMALTHPGIVRTHTFEQDSTGAAIVMEYIDGLTFSDWKERQPGRCFETEEILPWLGPLCEALDYAHRDARIVHRDLKPRNIMISHEGRLKVADFGISATISETASRATGQGPTSGTPAYMSPQQLQGKRPSPLDDVYALGATIYDLLAGRPPFFRGTMSAIFHQLLTEPAPSITERREELEITGKAPIPAVWEQTVAACLAKEPEDRPQSCAEVLARLRGHSSASGPPRVPATSKLRPVTPATAPGSAPRSGGFQPPTPPAAPEAPISPVKRGGLSPAPVGRQSTAAPSPTAPPPWRNPKWLVTAATGLLTLIAAVVFFLVPKLQLGNVPGLESSASPAPPRETGASPPMAFPSQSLGTRDGGTRSVVSQTSAGEGGGKVGADGAAPSTVTKEAPFVNSLGMKFVPVPGTNVLFCIHETRRKDYAAYATQVSGVDAGWRTLPPYVEDNGELPVVNVSWSDAQAFCAWLANKEGKSYRLPTDKEWSFAVGIGVDENWSNNTTPEMLDGKLQNRFPWDGSYPPNSADRAGNYADISFSQKSPRENFIDGYDDGFPNLAPVMSFKPNILGIYDLGGNAMEWCEDWYNRSQTNRVLRGMSWHVSGSSALLSSRRFRRPPNTRNTYEYGFRCVLSLSTSATSAAPTAGSATTPAPVTPAATISTPAPATPKPQNETQKWLVQVEAIYQPMYLKEVVKPYEEDMADLKKNTLATLDREIAAASRTANLRDALAFRNERQRIDADQGVPADDRDTPPAALKTLRATWRTQSAHLETDRRQHAQSVYGQYDKVLASNQAALTQHQRLDEALLLQQRRDALAKEWASLPPAIPTTATKDHPFVNSLGMQFVPVPGTNVLFCIHETRRMDYAAYDANVPGLSGAWKDQKQDGVPCGHEDNHPVVGVSWEDAQAFCAWLSNKEGKSYRLPTDREWSFAVGIGRDEKWAPDTTPKMLDGKVRNQYPWGNEWPPPSGAGNYADIAGKKAFPRMSIIELYNDGFATTAPVMSFRPNSTGIYDLGGNVWEWCDDWFDTTRIGRVTRGNAWNHFSQPGEVASSRREEFAPNLRLNFIGFRCVLTLSGPLAAPASARNNSEPPPASTPVPSPTSRATGTVAPATPHPTVAVSNRADTALAKATKEAPFVNSLGMKFVPVPGTKVLFCIHETRRKDYAAYAAETPGVDGGWKRTDYGDFNLPGPIDEHPVWRMTWEAAHSFCAWLSKKEGLLYRLPTDKEWSYAAGIGHKERWTKETTPQMLAGKETTEYPWGNKWPPPPGAGNYADTTWKARFPGEAFIDGYDDGFVATAPVMSFPPNKIGLYDMGGNVWEWCEDWFNGEKKERVLRGGAFNSDNNRGRLLSSSRDKQAPGNAIISYGFRCVVELPEP